MEKGRIIATMMTAMPLHPLGTIGAIIGHLPITMAIEALSPLQQAGAIGSVA